MFTGLVNEYRDLLRQSEEESNRLWEMYDKAVRRVDVANAELDKLAFDYNQLADTLCRTDDLLAQTEDKLAAIEAENNRLRGFLPVERPHPLDTIAELRGQLAEARAIAGELFAYLRADVDDPRALQAAYMRIRPSVRRMLSPEDGPKPDRRPKRLPTRREGKETYVAPFTSRGNSEATGCPIRPATGVPCGTRSLETKRIPASASTLTTKT